MKPAVRMTVGTLLAAWTAPLVQAMELEAPTLEAPAEEAFQVRVYWENDSSILVRNHPTDRYYTNGAGASLAYRPAWADRLADHMPFAERFGPAKTAAGVVAGQLMFTPEDLRASQPLPEDHPYSGYLFAGVFWQRANERTMDHFQLDVGLVGESSLAEDIQEVVHHIGDGVEPEGWDNQLRDEPTIQATIRKFWRLPMGGFELGLPWEMELIPDAELALGTVQRHVGGGATLRMGVNLPDDFGVGGLRRLGAATGQVEPGWGGYGFVRLGGRLVEHNLFLEGNTWKNSLGVDEEPAVGELQVGLAVHHHRGDWNLALGYWQTFLTDEFKTQSTGHNYGSLTLSLQGRF